jgi:hypothetical protein
MGRTYTVNSGAVALAATVAKSLILVNPSVTFVLAEVGISFDASAASAPCVVDLYRTTSVTGAAGAAATVVKENANADSASSNVASSLVVLTAEPASVEILRSFYVQPFGGLVVLQFPLGREPQMSGTSTNRLGIRATMPTGVTGAARAWFAFEE